LSIRSMLLLLRRYIIFCIFLVSLRKLNWILLITWCKNSGKCKFRAMGILNWVSNWHWKIIHATMKPRFKGPAF
jgi:hypothetical protein